jgi:hypothetical protein
MPTSQASLGDSNFRNPITIEGNARMSGDAICNNPITPVTGSNWTLFCFFLALLGLAGLLYLFLHRPCFRSRG